MRNSFPTEMENLHAEMLRMGHLVEEAVADAVNSLANQDIELARQVIRKDDVVDDLQIEIEKHCLNILAVQQPISNDLRVVGTALKIVTDLERMADHAVDIAKITVRLEGQPLIKPLIDIPRMAELAQHMTREAINAYVEQSTDLALRMAATDDAVDHLYDQIFRELLVLMMEDPRTIRQATHLIFVAQFLERIADHATNLGEWVVYMVTGERRELNK